MAAEGVTVFDFDGTLTRGDTLPPFIRHCVGTFRFLLGFGLFTPQILLMKAGVLNNSAVKERLLSYFFKGWREVDFKEKCRTFAPKIKWRDDMLKTMRKAIETQRVIIISANLYDMLRAALPAEVDILATDLAVSDGRLTGRYAGANCFGAEKVCRLNEYLSHNNNPLPPHTPLTVYTDSLTDRPLLDIATEGHLIK